MIAAESQRWVATVVKVPVRLVPTVPITVTAATAISAAMRPYSIAVTPDWFLRSFVKAASTAVSPAKFEQEKGEAKELAYP
jgi:hypothetical protein